MNSLLTANIVRFLLLVLTQVWVFKRIAFDWGEFGFIHFIVYPLFIMLLPIKLPRPIVVGLGFLIGIIIDFFYDSPGVHASAGVFTAYARGWVLDFIEPYEGYNTNDSPTLDRMGMSWFMTYCSILLGLHLVWYFSVEAFSFVHFFEIVMNSIFSFIASFVLIILLLFIFRPKT